MTSHNAYYLLNEEGESLGFHEGVSDSNANRSSLQKQDLLNFQKVKKLLIANGFIRSNKMTSIRWSDIMLIKSKRMSSGRS